MLCELLIFEASLNTTYTATYKAVLQDGSTSFSIRYGFAEVTISSHSERSTKCGVLWGERSKETSFSWLTVR